MVIIRERPTVAVAIAFVVGLLIGWLAIGWGLWPVEWTGGGPQHLAEADQNFFLRTVADLYSFNQNTEMVQTALSGWNGAEAACQLASQTQDASERARLEAIATVANGIGCTGIGLETQPTTPEVEGEGEGSSIPFLLILALVFVIAVLGFIFVYNQRRSLTSTESSLPRQQYDEVPEAPPVSSGDDALDAVPIARFRTTYKYGHDVYDDSFSIENANGDFLGECGVSIAESIGADSPKNVTAFEVWLFDKNDIRTITKVIMSDHAFFDDAIKAKLAPKGEPVLARENETIVLDTASLIINAEITSMAYGTGALPPKSFFEEFTIELSAWAKEGDFDEPDIQGRVDEILNY